jgi:hypothetical protein
MVLQVFKLVEDPDKMAKCLVNLSNIYELQVMERGDGNAEAVELQYLWLEVLGQIAMGWKHVA